MSRTTISTVSTGQVIASATTNALIGNDADHENRIVSNASAIAGAAPLASPALTGTPTAPTATSGTNTTQIATTAFVSTAVAGVSGGGSGTPPYVLVAAPTGVATTDTANINTALSAASTAGGGMVVFRATNVNGPYYKHVGTPCVVPSYVRIAGMGKNGTIIQKTDTNAIFSMSGSSTSVRCSQSSLEHLMLYGDGSHGGPLVTASYADHLNFDHVYFQGNPGPAFIGIELWDSYFTNVESDNCGTSTYATGAAFQLLSSATDSTNEIYFSHFRCESMAGNAVFIGDAGNSPPSYGIYFTDVKMESAFCNGNSFLDMSGSTRDVHIKHAYFAADSLASGGTAIDGLINLVAYAGMVVDGVHGWVNAGAASSVIRVYPGANGHAIRDVMVEMGSGTLSNGIVHFAGGTPAMLVNNVSYITGQSGTLYGGTIPSTVQKVTTTTLS